MLEEIRLLEGEACAAIAKHRFSSEDTIALNRGHWEVVVPVLADAQIKKMTGIMAAYDSDDNLLEAFLQLEAELRML